MTTALTAAMIGAVRRPVLVLTGLAVLALTLASACGSSADEPAMDVGAEGETAASNAASNAAATAASGAPTTAGLPYATGPAVLVPGGYEPPGDRVDSTGAYLPANGKPTLVFVDAIW